MVKVGDSIPSVELHDGSPGTKVDIANEIKSGKALLVGIPGAFSPGCSQTHIPGYIAHPDIKNHKVYVIAVNDAFCLTGWAKILDPDLKSGIRYLADAGCELTEKLDMVLDAKPYFGNLRSKRYAIKTEDGKVVSVDVEPDPSKVTVAAAEKQL